MACASGQEEVVTPADTVEPTPPAQTETPVTTETPPKAAAEEFLSDPTDSPPPEKAKLSIENDAFTLPGSISFESGGPRIRKESESTLEALAGYLVSRADVTTVRVEGHTAKDGDEAKNQALSEARAMAVARWLKLRGVDCKRIVAVGFGSNKPVADNASADGKTKNTRIVVAPAALRGRLIGGMPAEGGGKPAGDVCK
jgi:OmpA-OmpF porin, OOP family